MDSECKITYILVKKNENISSRSEDIKKSIFRGFGDVFPYLGVYEI